LCLAQLCLIAATGAIGRQTFRDASSCFDHSGSTHVESGD